ncbi:MAG TPA: PrsW family intramembrane metalloprotease [Spirochaetales bacterium]|nr:PrsW family intramembrane metalloprotease [Spirochaetales bacterium]
MLGILIFDFVAAVLWIFFLTRLDPNRKDKKSVSRLIKFFLAGLLSVIPTLLLYEILIFDYIDSGSWVLYSIIEEFLIVGPVEEFSKFIIFFLFSRKLKSTREPIDVILQAGAVALAFATVENIFYGTFVHPDILFFRWLFCATGHLAYSSIWAFYCIAVYYGNNSNKSRHNYLLIIFSIFPAAFLHGLYNFMLDMGLPLGALLVSAIALSLAYCIYRILLKTSPYRLFTPAEYKQAIPVMLQGLKRNPGSVVLNRRLALFYLHTGDYRKSLKHLERCRKISPNNAYVKSIKAVALIMDGKIERGENLLSRSFRRMDSPARWIFKRNIKRMLSDTTDGSPQMKAEQRYNRFFVDHFFSYDTALSTASINEN